MIGAARRSPPCSGGPAASYMGIGAGRWRLLEKSATLFPELKGDLVRATHLPAGRCRASPRHDWAWH